MEFPDNANLNTLYIKLKDSIWVVRWSIVHKCQTLIKGIFNNLGVNCICGIVPQAIFHRGGAKLTHLADWWPVTTSNAGF